MTKTAPIVDFIPRARPLWRVVLGLHVPLAVIAWWMLPGGFPLWHSRFWFNQVLPLAIAVVCLCGLVTEHRRKLDYFTGVVLAVVTFWSCAILAGIALFPISSKRLFMPGLVAACMVWLCYGFSFRGNRLRWAMFAVWLVAGGAVGVLAVFAQRGGEPSTRPFNLPLAEVTAVAESVRPATVELGEGLSVQPVSGVVRLQGGMTVEVRPLLTFISRSPDRCWTILALAEYRKESWSRLTAFHQVGSDVRMEYEGFAAQRLRVWREQDTRTVRLEAESRLAEPVYSHLNTFTELAVSGHGRLHLQFSPCPEERFEVAPSDYPVGRPMRLAYVDRQGQFHLVEARSGEKGPFRQLASGPLLDRPLSITLFDGDRAVCRITMMDWSAQCSFDLSPTAGWGLPVNAIEFSLLGNEPNSPAAIWFTLAGTSVGRGWDSVGHAAGTYRNRMTLEPLP